MERVRELREAKNMTQLNLGMKLEVAQETISGYEIGRAEPNMDMLVKLADALDTSVDYLLGRTDIKVFAQFGQSDLSSDELELINAFRKMPEAKRQRALGLFAGLSD